MTIAEQEKRDLIKMIDMSGFNVILSTLAEIAEDRAKLIDESWEKKAFLTRDASKKIADSTYEPKRNCNQCSFVLNNTRELQNHKQEYHI